MAQKFLVCGNKYVIFSMLGVITEEQEFQLYRGIFCLFCFKFDFYVQIHTP